jgi:hypothetical protein
MKELTRISFKLTVTCKCVMNGWEKMEPTRLKKDVLKMQLKYGACSAFRSEAFDSAFRGGLISEDFQQRFSMSLKEANDYRATYQR